MILFYWPKQQRSGQALEPDQILRKCNVHFMMNKKVVKDQMKQPNELRIELFRPSHSPICLDCHLQQNFQIQMTYQETTATDEIIVE